MGSYQQTNAWVSSQTVPGTQADWYTPTTPVQAISSESPGGPGDVLKYARLSMSIGVSEYHAFSLAKPAIFPYLSLAALGEVYEVGTAGFPDPTSSAAPSGVISATACMSGGYTVLTSGDATEWGTMTTGEVVSRGQRGPAKYGPGHPELRIGLFVAGIVLTDLPLDQYYSTWTYWLRCLWYVP